MDIVVLIGRIFFGGYFLMMGMNHFMKFGMMKGYAQSKGVPAAGLGIIVSGLLMVLGGLSVLLGAYMQIGLWLLIIFLMAAAFKMHTFWKEQDQQAKMMEMLNFTRNVALSGAAAIMFALPQPMMWSLGL